MSSLLGIGLEIWAIVIPILIVLIGIIWKFAHWKGGLDQWKNDASTTLTDLQTDVKSLMTDVGAIKVHLEKSIKNGMVGYHSPFVASPKAIEVLEQISLLTEIDANYSYIVEKVNERSKLPIYSDIKGLERQFIEIAPGVIHELIKAGKIEEKKIDIAMDELENTFKAGTVGYYAVLLVITAYILEKVRAKGYPADVSMVYSQIDAMGSDSPDELLEMFDGDIDRAIESYETAVRSLEEIDSEDLAENQMRLAVLYGMVGKKDEALERLKDVIDHNPDYATAHYNIGVLLYDLKRYGEAEEAYREAIRADPNDVTSHSNLGFLLYDLKRYDEAEESYREAIRADPDDATAQYDIGVLLCDLKRYGEAEEAYREAIRAEPDLAAAHYNIGVLLNNLKRYGEAEEAYREAIRAEPDLAAAHTNLGVLLSTLDREEEAIQEFNIALNLKDQLPDKGERIMQALEWLKTSHS
jgi:tetratricopeptide (TPR) repeat protein